MSAASFGLLVTGCLLMGCSCGRKTEVDTDGTSGSKDTPANTHLTADTGADDSDSGRLDLEPFVLPVPPTAEFVPDARFPDCRHPGVRKQCSDGWCRIPAGCYIFGSPETEPKRALNAEEQGPLTLTRAFEISQNEVTQEEWKMAGLDNRSALHRSDLPDVACLEPDCPVGNVSWYDTLLYANALSEAHQPPLQPCYLVNGCQEPKIYGTECEGYELTAPTVYDCEGYRLPTHAEWQYAARAGTTTAYYSGDITVFDPGSDCIADPNLEPIAWYCANAGGTIHPVAQKLSNAWGLHDILGNSYEWIYDRNTALALEYPATDPAGYFHTSETRLRAGGRFNSWPSLLRSASALSAVADIGGQSLSFRLVRTLSPTNMAARDAGVQ